MIFVVIIICAALAVADYLLKDHARKGTLPDMLIDESVVFDHIENTGITFSLLKDHPKIASILPFAFFFTLLPTIPCHWKKQNSINNLGILMILCGAISNLWDRLKRHSVTDMLRFPNLPGKLKHLCWNLADFMIIVGSVLLILSAIFPKKKQ